MGPPSLSHMDLNSEISVSDFPFPSGHSVTEVTYAGPGSRRTDLQEAVHNDAALRVSVQSYMSVEESTRNGQVSVDLC